jgi:hypothetical protein
MIMVSPLVKKTKKKRKLGRIVKMLLNPQLLLRRISKVVLNPQWWLAAL